MKTYEWTEQQKKALRGSIRKWIRIYNRTDVDKGPVNCACCRIWNQAGGDCGGCPIKTFTGKSFCRGTPYVIWSNNGHLIELNAEQYSEDAIFIALAFANFLRAVYLAGGGK